MSRNVFLELDGFEGSSRPRQDGVGDSLLERVVSFFYDSVDEFSKLSPFDSLYDFWVSRLDALSLPDGLGQVFLQGVVDGLYYNNVEHFDSCASVFVSCLVENYFRGSSLVLDVSNLDSSLNNLGFGLRNKSLEVIGDVGRHCGDSSEGCSFAVKGSVGNSCGFKSVSCSYVVKGDVGGGCGSFSSGCSYVIGGDVGGGCGYHSDGCSYVIDGSVGVHLGNFSSGCSYVVMGDAGDFCGRDAIKCEFFIGGSVGDYCGIEAKNCLFKTPNKTTYEKICKSVAESNTVQLVDEKGLVLEEFRK